MRTCRLPLALIAALGATSAALSNATAGPLAAIGAITGDVTIDLTVGGSMEFRYSRENADTLDAFKPSGRVSVG